MSHRYVIGVLVVALLGLGGWALAQPDRPAAKDAAPASGPFTVSPAGDSAVLLETRSGKTWVLQRSVQGDSVWLPARRIDSEEDALRWTAQQEDLKEKIRFAERQKAPQ